MNIYHNENSNTMDYIVCSNGEVKAGIWETVLYQEAWSTSRRVISKVPHAAKFLLVSMTKRPDHNREYKSLVPKRILWALWKP
jgi:hypothetical protein